ncbi:MAG TPA: hypothetical protein VGG45_15665 [Terracidiphilus sp.]|jgi:hypothetical protein
MADTSEFNTGKKAIMRAWNYAYEKEVAHLDSNSNQGAKNEKAFFARGGSHLSAR